MLANWSPLQLSLALSWASLFVLRRKDGSVRARRESMAPLSKMVRCAVSPCLNLASTCVLPNDDPILHPRTYTRHQSCPVCSRLPLADRRLLRLCTVPLLLPRLLNPSRPQGRSSQLVDANGRLTEDRGGGESKAPEDTTPPPSPASPPPRTSEASVAMLPGPLVRQASSHLGPRRRGVRAMLHNLRSTLKLDGFMPEYHGLYKLLGKLMQDGATHEGPCISAAAVLMRLLSMRAAPMNLPGAQGVRRRLLTQFFNRRSDRLKTIGGVRRALCSRALLTLGDMPCFPLSRAHPPQLGITWCVWVWSYRSLGTCLAWTPTSSRPPMSSCTGGSGVRWWCMKRPGAC